MIPLIGAAAFTGYLLVYAAVAHGGRYAAKPWDALTDTGAPGGPTGASTASQGGAGQSTLGKLIGLSHWLPGIGGFLP